MLPAILRPAWHNLTACGHLDHHVDHVRMAGLMRTSDRSKLEAAICTISSNFV